MIHSVAGLAPTTCYHTLTPLAALLRPEGASAHRARAPRAPRAEADASLTGEMHTFFRQVPPF